MKLTISKALKLFSPEDFYAYIKGLYAATTNSTQSKAVPRINLNQTKSGKTIVKIEGAREVTTEELELLTIEYARTKEELLSLFSKRKIVVIDSETKEPLNVSIPKRPRKARAKKDVEPNEGFIG